MFRLKRDIYLYPFLPFGFFFAYSVYLVPTLWHCSSDKLGSKQFIREWVEKDHEDSTAEHSFPAANTETQAAFPSPAVPSRGDLHEHIGPEEGAEIVAEIRFLVITL